MLDVVDNSFYLSVEKLLVSLIELGDSDAFLLADVKLLLQCLVFCHWDCRVEWSGVVVG